MLNKFKQILIFYLTLTLILLPILNCGTQIEQMNKQEEKATSTEDLFLDIPDPSREAGDGGVEATEIPIEAPPEGCTNMRDCLARQEEERGGEVEMEVVDEDGNLVWDQSKEQPLWCLPDNPNTSTLKRLHVKVIFCINRSDAFVIDADKVYFQHFSAPNNYIDIDLENDEYMDWWKYEAGIAGGGLAIGGPVGLIIIAAAAVVALCDFLVEFVMEIFGKDDCPEMIPMWEPADVGLDIRCADMFEMAKITTNNSILNKKEDIWVSPAALSYDLNIGIDHNCTTSVRDFQTSFSDRIMIGFTQRSNGGEYTRYAATLYNNLSNAFTIDNVILEFDYFYFALEDI